MRFAIMDGNTVSNVALAEEAYGLAQGWTPCPDEVSRNWTLDGDTWVPEVVVPVVPESVSALQGLMAIDQAGLAAPYEAWANDPARTFTERSFVQHATTWRRSSPVIATGAAALGLTSQELDDLFILAATLTP